MCRNGVIKWKGENNSSKTYTHRCEPTEGGRGNLLLNRMYYNSFKRYEIATPERFSVQARNDKSIYCFVASPFAMTESSPHQAPKRLYFLYPMVHCVRLHIKLK